MKRRTCRLRDRSALIGVTMYDRRTLDGLAYYVHGGEEALVAAMRDADLLTPTGRPSVRGKFFAKKDGRHWYWSVLSVLREVGAITNRKAPD